MPGKQYLKLIVTQKLNFFVAFPEYPRYSAYRHTAKKSAEGMEDCSVPEEGFSVYVHPQPGIILMKIIIVYSCNPQKN